MKFYSTILFCLFCFGANAQFTLSSFSKGKLYATDEIKDEKNNIKGYFLLFQTDMLAKETYELEYVVLDENLTKVTNGFITEMKFESFLVDAKNIIVKVQLYKNKLLLELTDNLEGDGEFFRRYRILNLENNQMSDAFIFNKDTLQQHANLDRKVKNVHNNDSEKIYFYNDIGLVVNSQSTDKKTGQNKKYLLHYDADFKEIWRYQYADIATDGKIVSDLEYVKSDSDVLVFFNHKLKNGYGANNYSIPILDAATGALRNEFIFPDLDQFAYRIVDCTITNDTIIVFANFTHWTNYGEMYDANNYGLIRYSFDKKTGKLLDTKTLKWEALAGSLPIKKDSYVKKEGYLYPHNMLLLENGKTIVVCEAFSGNPVLTNNMYYLTLTKDFTFESAFEVTKFKNMYVNTFATSVELKDYGYFDFIDYQNLGNDEFIFLFDDNEKRPVKRKNSRMYGIVTYLDGKFSRQSLDLSTKTSAIFLHNAKKGYVQLIEDFDDKTIPSTIRLEKINY